MPRTALLAIAGILVLAGSATTAALVLQDDDVTVSASCVPIMDTDRDKAGVVDHVAVVTATEQSPAPRTADGRDRVTVQVRVDEVLKGALPKTMPIDQGAQETANAEYEHQALVPGHRYVIGVHNWDAEGGSTTVGRGAFFATSADGGQLQRRRQPPPERATARLLRPCCRGYRGTSVPWSSQKLSPRRMSSRVYGIGGKPSTVST
ncbi:hypothetical protein [Streptomyces sp. NPDC094032]|uniref:hypothetical protein n=1 Tax=Streptomyces sp. NPDC094032 TaxID=3155308 RepID=UPI0033230532